MNETLITVDLVNQNIKGVLDLSEYPELIALHCSNNEIEEIINFPETLIGLSCNKNKITKLSNLPNSLQHIECDHNMCFDRFPDSLQVLFLVKGSGTTFYKDFDLFKTKYPDRFSEGTDYILK
jgi:Leucine-rich repeat (LRR) protein